MVFSGKIDPKTSDPKTSVQKVQWVPNVQKVNLCHSAKSVDEKCLYHTIRIGVGIGIGVVSYLAVL
jgi:hypothetical protein